MAAIDSLLSLIDAQKASGLVLRTREPPVLTAAQGRGLTMPPLSAEMLETFAAEALAPGELEQLRASGACDAVYRSARHGAFAVEARRSGDKLSLKLRRSGAVVAKPAAPPPTSAIPAAVEVPGHSVASSPTPSTAPLAAARAVAPAHLAGAIARAIDSTVSDIIVSAGQPLWIRAGNSLASSGELVDQEEILALVDSLLDPPRRRHLDATGSVDLAWEAPAVDAEGPRRLRVNVFRQAHGLAMALRPVNRHAPTLAELNLPDSIGALGDLAGGMVLVVGTAGSGKSTTLAAIVELVNRTRARHVITLEDPIELVYQPRRCLIHQREIGSHVESFAAGLRAALRECPNIILVGEMRDRETISLALTAAETGHLVLSTLHSGSAPMAIDRIVDSFPEHQQAQICLQLAGSLRAVVTQRLLDGALPGTRYPALEMLTVNYAVGALIREGKTHQLATQIQTGRDDGMVALDSSLLDLVRSGRISQAVALAAARDPIELQRRMR
jgi:twitching motility protein PilT